MRIEKEEKMLGEYGVGVQERVVAISELNPGRVGTLAEA